MAVTFSASRRSFLQTYVVVFVSGGENPNKFWAPPLSCTAKSGKSYYNIYIGGGQRGPASAFTYIPPFPPRLEKDKWLLPGELRGKMFGLCHPKLLYQGKSA